MKKILIVLALGVALLTSCTGVKTVATGLENDAFLSFIGSHNDYSSGVEVQVDDATNFVATVDTEKSKRPKGNVYAISTGTHWVTVSHNKKVIYKKQIFVGAQETKKIVLP